MIMHPQLIYNAHIQDTAYVHDETLTQCCAHLSIPQMKAKTRRKIGVVDLHIV
jgi:hypothetical protein